MKFWETAARTLTARPVFSVCGERQASDSVSQLVSNVLTLSGISLDFHIGFYLPAPVPRYTVQYVATVHRIYKSLPFFPYDSA